MGEVSLLLPSLHHSVLAPVPGQPRAHEQGQACQTVSWEPEGSEGWVSSHGLPRVSQLQGFELDPMSGGWQPGVRSQADRFSEGPGHN